MPELPEVETVRRLAERVLVGRRLVHVETVDDDIVYETPPDAVRDALSGATVTGTGRKGKVFWWHLDHGATLFGHLGMAGWLREVGDDGKRLVSHGSAPLQDGQGRPRFLKLLVAPEIGSALALTDGRRLARVWLGGDPSDDRRVQSLGPDAWLEEVDVKALQSSKAAVKTLLLDQSRFAGIGNWVADEVLLAAGVSPHRTGDTLTDDECQRIAHAIKAVLDVAVRAEADHDRYPADWLFHVRWGGGRGPTHLHGEEVRRDSINGRTAAWLPARQH